MAQRAVLGLDLDGTLLDCRPRQEAVLLSIVPQAAAPKDRLWTLKRSGMSTLSALEYVGISVPPAFHDLWIQRIEADKFLMLDPLLPHVRPALEHLSTIAKLHLITSRQRPDGVQQTLERLALSSFFSEVSIVKPGHGAAKAKAALLGPNDVVAHCGDSEVDAKAAQCAKRPFFAVTCGQRSKDFLNEIEYVTCTKPSLFDLIRPIETLIEQG